jgi:hypothetical protein
VQAPTDWASSNRHDHGEYGNAQRKSYRSRGRARGAIDHRRHPHADRQQRHQQQDDEHNEEGPLHCWTTWFIAATLPERQSKRGLQMRARLTVPGIATAVAMAPRREAVIAAPRVERARVWNIGRLIDTLTPRASRCRPLTWFVKPLPI